MHKNKLLVILICILVCLTLFTLVYINEISNKTDNIIINYYSQPDTNGVITEIINKFENENPGIIVNLVELPDNTDDKLETLKKAFQSGQMQVDVFDADVIWPPIFASSGWVEPLEDYISEEELSKYLPESVQANIFMGQLWGIPYRIDAGMLYYRKDLLDKYNKSVPTSWDELVETSKYIMEKEGEYLEGFGASWDKFEGLTANSFEYIWSFGGEVFKDKDSQEVAINSFESIQGIQFMIDMIYKYDITSDDITSYSSGDIRKKFYEGNLLFMRDWSSGWEISQETKDSKGIGKVGVSELPLGNIKGNNFTTLGGWQVMVSAFSKNKEAAIAFAKYRTSEESQKVAAIRMSHLPSIKKLYNDTQINASMPFLKYMYPSFKKSYVRPVSPYYQEISTTIQNAIHRALLNEITPKMAVEIIEINIINILETKQSIEN